MKYLLSFVAITMIFFSCKKKMQEVVCYQCSLADSIWSNVPELASPHAGGGDFEICNYSESRKNDYVRDHNYADTLKHVPDTIVLKYHVVTCNRQ